LANPCEHDNKTSGCVKGGEILTSRATISFSRRNLLSGVGIIEYPLKYLPVTFITVT